VSLSFWISHQYPICIPLLPHSCYMPCSRPVPRLHVRFRNKLIFYDEELLAPRTTSKLEDHPLSDFRDCLFNIFAATLHTWRVSPPSATWGRAMPWWLLNNYRTIGDSITNLILRHPHHPVSIYPSLTIFTDIEKWIYMWNAVVLMRDIIRVTTGVFIAWSLCRATISYFLS
jgi:hypothetical protein